MKFFMFLFVAAMHCAITGSAKCADTEATIAPEISFGCKMITAADWLRIARGEIKTVYMKTRKGAVITQVTDDAPAKKAGLQPSDHIVEVNGTVVESPGHMIDLVKSAGGPGTKVLLRIYRPTASETRLVFRQHIIEVTLEAKKPAAPVAAPPTAPITKTEATQSSDEYDRFEDRTARSLIFQRISPRNASDISFIWMAFVTSFPGKECKTVPPLVGIAVVASADDYRAFVHRSSDINLLIDGERVRLEPAARDIDWGLGVSTEAMRYWISGDDLLRLAAAKEIEGRIYGAEWMLTVDQIQALRDLAKSLGTPATDRPQEETDEEAARMRQNRIV